ncbi:uncharacterized protein LAJ45_05097 [Morchella importuna]|uniref:uncharacterized protein n=1 Tax=Morchella importuna TaxID=1174673 RepID=UPI001E8EB491|nr:uncharacterized protein LAJ45_05097 [Morchella importuna]KAH8150915.1 hypothetical protein LAJ45_05097 [Morchella importuna]
MQSLTGRFDLASWIGVSGGSSSRPPKKSNNDRGPSSASAWGVYDKGRPNLPDGNQDSSSDKIEVDSSYLSHSWEDKSKIPSNDHEQQTISNTSKRPNEAPYMHDTRQEYPDIHIKGAGARVERSQRTPHDKRCTDSNIRYSNKRLEDDIRQRVEAQLEKKHREKCEAMLRKINQDQKSLEKNKIQLRELENAYKNSLVTLEESRSAFAKKEQETQDVISKLKSNINDLTVSVSRTVNANGITTRDDDYFEAEFASLKNSIHQWARQSFRQIDAITYDQLPTRLSNLLGVSIPGFKITHDSRIGSTEFEAIMVYTMLFDTVFEPRFLLPWESMAPSLKELYNPEQSGGYQRPDMMGTLQHYLGGTDLKKRELFAQTIEDPSRTVE